MSKELTPRSPETVERDLKTPGEAKDLIKRSRLASLNFTPIRKVKEEPRLFTTRQIAEFVGVSPRTIQNWVRGGIISYYKIGKPIRFCPEKVLADLEKFRCDVTG